MSYLDELREAHKARRQRLGTISLPMKRTAIPTVPAKKPEIPPALNVVIKDTLEAVADRLAMPSLDAPQYPTMRQLLREVAAKHGVDEDTIRCKMRTAPIVKIRNEFFYRAVKETMNSYPAIGRFLGGRDHTTVMYAVSCHCVQNDLPYPRGEGLALWRRAHLQRQYSERRTAQRRAYREAMKELRA